MKETTIIEDAEKIIEKEKMSNEEPSIIEEIKIEELAIDGICGVY